MKSTSVTRNWTFFLWCAAIPVLIFRFFMTDNTLLFPMKSHCKIPYETIIVSTNEFSWISCYYIISTSVKPMMYQHQFFYYNVVALIGYRSQGVALFFGLLILSPTKHRVLSCCLAVWLWHLGFQVISCRCSSYKFNVYFVWRFAMKW